MFGFKWFQRVLSRRGGRRLENRIFGLPYLKRVLSIRNQLFAERCYGPFIVYYAEDLAPVMDSDYADVTFIRSPVGEWVPASTPQTVRDRICKVEGVIDCAVDYGMEPASLRLAPVGPVIRIDQE